MEEKGAEVPDRIEDTQHQATQAEPDTGPSEAQRESLENVKDTVDDHRVEAAGRKGGWKAALATRFDAMAGFLGRERKNLEDTRRNILALAQESKHGISFLLRMEASAGRVMAETSGVGERLAGRLRDRLQLKGTESPSSK